MAGYYPNELINEIIAANDIYDVVNLYLPLQKSGSAYKGLCPFHSEKTPSFGVSPDKQLFHCFGCGEAGTVLHFIMKIESLDFVEAVKFLADRAKIALPEGDSASDEAAKYIKKQKLYQIYVEAARFYHSMLMDKEGEKARAYLAKRGIDHSFAVKFGLGFAPDSYDRLYAHLRQKGFDEYIIADSGLCRKKETGSKAYDFFRNRVLFPIIDIRGNVIAFGGRIMGSEQGPKYLNSADSDIFSKSNTLYALNFAKHTCKDKLILCEGYMDVIALHKNGITNAVAALGTAFTALHARIISRYTKEIYLCYDSDEAGKKAVQSAAALLDNVLVRTFIIELPGAKDPDEYIAKKGVQSFLKLLDGAKTTVKYTIELIRQKYDADNIEQKVMMVSEMANVFAKLTNRIEIDVLVKETAAKYNIDKDAIFTEINKLRYKNGRKRNTGYIKEEKNIIITNEDDVSIFSINKEALLITLLCEYENVYGELKEEITPDFFTDLHCQNFAKLLFEKKQRGEKPEKAAFMALLDPESAKTISAYMIKHIAYNDPLNAAKQMIDGIKEERSRQSIKNINDPYELDKYIKSIKKKQK